MKHRWFLPESPDLLGMLRTQLDTTEAAMVAFVGWAHGEADKSDEVRALEHRADEEKRELWRTLRTAFVTPIDAEDLFVLSSTLDEILNGTKDVVREADVMSLTPDAAVAAMGQHLLEGLRHLGEAFDRLGSTDGDATSAADAAIKSQRALERDYRRAMSALVAIGDLREVIGRRELYGRLVTVGEHLRAVAERVWYAVVKES